MSETSPSNDDYFTLAEIADQMRFSQRWVRRELNKPGNTIEHSRPGGRIRMTAEQIRKFKAAYEVAPVAQPMTTTRKRRSA